MNLVRSNLLQNICFLLLSSVSFYAVYVRRYFSMFNSLCTQNHRIGSNRNHSYRAHPKISHDACRHSITSSTRSATSRISYGRTYDMYDAQADACREQRTQFLLGIMAACEIICIGPLMVLR